jgi:hypothetical protein
VNGARQAWVFVGVVYRLRVAPILIWFSVNRFETLLILHVNGLEVFQGNRKIEINFRALCGKRSVIGATKYSFVPLFLNLIIAEAFLILQILRCYGNNHQHNEANQRNPSGFVQSPPFVAGLRADAINTKARCL